MSAEHRPKALLVHHTLNPPGGGGAVGAWAIQALREHYELTVFTWGPVDIAGVNRGFGTSLQRSDARWRDITALLRAPVDAFPSPLALLSSHLVFRCVRALLAQERFDVVIGTNNEIDVGRTAIQYIHYPWAKMPRPDADYRWYHHSLPLRFYRSACMRLSGYRAEQIRRNVTLVNSDWTGRVFERYYGATAQTLYPPVAGGFPCTPFEAREEAFACVGRISGEKEIDKLITILTQVRARGHALRFHIIGPLCDQRYWRGSRGQRLRIAPGCRFTMTCRVPSSCASWPAAGTAFMGWWASTSASHRRSCSAPAASRSCRTKGGLSRSSAAMHASSTTPSTMRSRRSLA